MPIEPRGQRNDPAIITCRGCNGWAARPRAGGNPAGWYALSVTLPEEMTARGRPYAWAGQFCSIGCLADAIPDLEQQEQLAHLAYEPVRPVAS